uniref:mTERF domain-containing protein 1, mitochondrial n=1 Tax=Ascaris lumbricoides TaxID=6252 RepID=A0A9J2PNW4_ASCLU
MLALRLAGRRLVEVAVLARWMDVSASKALCTNPSPPARLAVTSVKENDSNVGSFDSKEVGVKESLSHVTDKDSVLAEDALKDVPSKQRLKRKWTERRARAAAVRTRINRTRARDADSVDSDLVKMGEENELTNKEKVNISNEVLELERRAEEVVRVLRKGDQADVATTSLRTEKEVKELTEEKPELHVNRYRSIVYSEGELDASDLSLPPSSEEKPELHVNRYRSIVYSEGELDASDLSLPPSRTNPHPFDPASDPSLLPPTHSRSLAQYVNHLPVLQNLVELGVDLLEVDTNNNRIGRHLVRLEWDRDVRPKLEWLLQLGLPITEFGAYLSRNPFFLITDLSSMKVRVNYLRSKKFTKKQIVKIITEFRYWLNTDVRTMDSRLGWIQNSFTLSGDEMRSLIVKEPRIVMFGIAPLQRLRNVFLKELQFTEAEVKQMLLEDPRLFLMDASHVTMSYAYLHYTMGLANGQLADYPSALRCSVASIRRRHEYLVKLRRDNYVEGTPDSISLRQLLHPSDRYFAVTVARTFLAAYNQFLKTY